MSRVQCTRDENIAVNCWSMIYRVHWINQKYFALQRDKNTTDLLENNPGNSRTEKPLVLARKLTLAHSGSCKTEIQFAAAAACEKPVEADAHSSRFRAHSASASDPQAAVLRMKHSSCRLIKQNE